jgi:hypothetical protein
VNSIVLDQEGKGENEMSELQCVRMIVASVRSVKKRTREKTKNNQEKR